MEDRYQGRKTKGGHPVVDLHRHKGLFRGVVIEAGRQRVMFWQRGGKLSQGAEHPYDIRRPAR